MTEKAFWQIKRLEEMNEAEWESLCDGCGRCCLNKLEDEDTGEIAWTDVACRLLDHKSCRCSDYAKRQEIVADCILLTPESVRNLAWLPPTCGYRLVAERHDLYWWHPLLSGDPDTVHQAGISVRGRAVSEESWPVEKLEERVVAWPGKKPRLRKNRGSGGKRIEGGFPGDRKTS